MNKEFKMVGGPFDGDINIYGENTEAVTSDENASLQFCYYRRGDEMIYWGKNSDEFFKWFLGRNRERKG